VTFDDRPADTPATVKDVREAIESLTEDDALRLRKAAIACLPGTEYESSHDILNEAVDRTMAAATGKPGRIWPKNRVTFVPFMIMTMRSIADGSRECHAVAKTDRFEVTALEGVRDHPMDQLGLAAPSVETEVVEAEERAEALAQANEDAAKIDAFFVADQEVGWLIMCLKEGESPSKARELAGFSETEYATIRKRLRRGAEKLFPGRRGG
jgi:hypothetical protein